MSLRVNGGFHDDMVCLLCIFMRRRFSPDSTLADPRSVQPVYASKPPASYNSSEPAETIPASLPDLGILALETTPSGICRMSICLNWVVGDSRPRVVAAIWRAVMFISTPLRTFSIKTVESHLLPSTSLMRSAAAISNVPVPHAGSIILASEKFAGRSSLPRMASPANRTAAGMLV